MDRPLVLDRTVRWGDCDPAGIIYTPRVLDYVTEAVEEWFRTAAGIDWPTMNRDRGLGAPTVHASCDYLRPMAPGLEFRVSVLLDRIGRSSLAFRVLGEDRDGRRLFEAKLVSCLTDFRAGRAVPIPTDVRERAEAYRAACAARA